MSELIKKLRVLFIGKKDDHYSAVAAGYIKQHIPGTLVVYSSRAEVIPDQVMHWEGDYLISYLAQWIIPADVLKKAKSGGINLHPGSPEYPGIGCTNFAIYNGENEFGITCHYMLPKVDTGDIISVKRFPLYKTDSVYSLTQRCYAAILQAFFELADTIISGRSPVISAESWKRKPYTRKELNELCLLTNDMDAEEKRKRIIATTFHEKVWAYTEVNGEKIYAVLNDEKK